MSGYSDWINAIVQLTGGYNLVDASSVTPTDDPDFNAVLPSAIADAEGMMYRDPDLDFLQARGTNSSVTSFAGVRYVVIPDVMLTVEQLCLVTPALSSPSTGTRVQLSRVTPEWLNAVYPQDTVTATPEYGKTCYALQNGTQALIGPVPDAQYTAEFYGVLRQTPLSATNPNTVLTDFWSDLFVAASMIYLSGFMKNFSAAGADSPPQAISWKSHYDNLKQGAAFISARQRYLSAGATAYPPAPQAATTR